MPFAAGIYSLTPTIPSEAIPARDFRQHPVTAYNQGARRGPRSFLFFIVPHL